MVEINGQDKPVSSYHSELALGFWSAVLVTLFNVISTLLMIPSWFLFPITEWRGIEAYASGFHFFQIASMAPGFLAVLAFLPLMTAVHYYASPERQVFSQLGIAFAAITVAMLGFQYYSQLTVVRYNLTGLEQPAMGLFVLGNPHSFFWPLESLGYGFMGLSTLFAAFVFPDGRLERWIRGLFLANGALGIGGIVVLPLEVATMAVLAGLALWTVLFPVGTILLALLFRRAMRSAVQYRILAA